MKTMTFNLPHPPILPRSPPPPIPPVLSRHHSRLIPLSKWFLTSSISSQPFRPQPGLVAGATHCDRWNESPEKSHLLINASRRSMSQSKNIYIFFHHSSIRDAGRWKKKKWERGRCYLKSIGGVFLYPQLISAVLWVAGGNGGGTFCIHLQISYCRSVRTSICIEMSSRVVFVYF